MSKLARENKLRERRVEKQAKKVARKLASAEQRDADGAPGRHEQGGSPTDGQDDLTLDARAHSERGEAG